MEQTVGAAGIQRSEWPVLNLEVASWKRWDVSWPGIRKGGRVGGAVASVRAKAQRQGGNDLLDSKNTVSVRPWATVRGYAVMYPLH